MQLSRVQRDDNKIQFSDSGGCDLASRFDARFRCSPFLFFPFFSCVFSVFFCSFSVFFSFFLFILMRSPSTTRNFFHTCSPFRALHSFPLIFIGRNNILLYRITNDVILTHTHTHTHTHTRARTHAHTHTHTYVHNVQLFHFFFFFLFATFFPSFLFCFNFCDRCEFSEFFFRSRSKFVIGRLNFCSSKRM